MLQRNMKNIIFTILVFTQINSVFAQKPTDLYADGMKKLEEGNTMGAIKDYSTAIAMDTNFAEAYLARGSVYAELETFDLALRDINKAILINPKLPEAFFNRAYIHLTMGNQRAALSDLNLYILLHPNDINAHLARLDLLIENQDKQEALKAMAAITKVTAENEEQYYQRGRIKMMVADTIGAFKDFNEAIRNKPDYMQAYKARARVLYLLKKYDEAIKDLNLYLMEAFNDAEMYGLRAECYAALSEGSLAIDNFTMALQLQPTNANLMFDRGYFLLMSKEYTDAKEDFKNALLLGFKDLDILYYNLGISEFHTEGKTKACASWKKAGILADHYLKEYCN